MSLGGWFKDYVYYPISVSKPIKKIGVNIAGWKSVQLKKAVSVVVPVMTTWILTGLWHGTGIGYVCWGLYYGFLILLSVTFSEDIRNTQIRFKINFNSAFYKLLKSIKIFIIFMGGRFLASTMSFEQRKNIIKNIFTNFKCDNFSKYGLEASSFLIIAFGVVLLIAISIIEKKENIYLWLNSQKKWIVFLIVYVILFMVFLLGIYGGNYDTSTFMYQQF